MTKKQPNQNNLTLQQQLDAADLQKRKKELDLQADTLAEKARILDEAPLTLHVLNAQIESKNNELESVIGDIAIAREELSVLHSDTQLLTEQTTKSLDALKIEVQKKEYELSNLEDTIQSRGRYLKDQEKIIDSTITEGNAMIHELNETIKIRQQELDDIKVDQDSTNRTIEGLKRSKVALKSEVDDLIIEKTLLEEDINRQEESSTSHIEALRQSKEELEEMVQKASREYQDIVHKTEQERVRLKEKQVSLRIKQDAINIERAQLEEDKRRWSSQKELYTV